jgi:signal transduction histidine kinase
MRNAPPTPAQLESGQRAVAQLTIVHGPGVGQRFNVDSGVIIGRSPDVQIVIDHEDVSRAHARLWRSSDDTFYLEDLRSRNGTFVGNVRIDRHALRYGDRIRFGSEVEFEFSAALGLSNHLAEKHRFEMLGRLGVGAAHDVHSLLTAVSASAASLKQMLIARGLSDRELLECASDVVLASSQAGRFAAAMMDFARGGRNERTIVDLSALVGEALQMLEPTLPPNISLQDRRPGEALMLGNRSDLLQIFLSLGWNAIDAMPNGGVLGIETRILDRAPTSGQFTDGQRVVVLSVSDTGVGMDEEVTQRVFDPFFTTKTPGQGYGLGLTTVRDLVGLSGGHVRLSSSPQQGSRFDVYFPALNTSAMRLVNTVQRAPHSRSTTKRKILLVDADGIIRRTLGRLLRGAGFDVVESGSGPQALEHLKQGTVDLAIVDAKAPGVGGHQLHERFAAIQPTICTILAVGAAGLEASETEIPRGDLLLLRKPFSFHQLLDVVERLLRPPARG